MEKILELLSEQPAKALDILRSQGKKPDEIKDYREENDELKRTKRDSQVDNIQQDKTIDNELIRAVRLKVDYNDVIVSTATAFEVGEPVTLIPQYSGGGESNLAKLIKQLWRTNRIDNIVQKAVAMKKGETQSAILMSIYNISKGSTMQKVLAVLGLGSQAKEIKVSLLDNEKGAMYPFMDSIGDMKYFLWEFSLKNADDKEEKHSWIYDATNVYKLIEGVAGMLKEPHGFDRIPVIYISQRQPEYYKAQSLIDRQEVVLSKFADSNDRTAYPILKTFGKIGSLPGKNKNGKVINFPMEYDPEADKYVHGDADYLTYQNAPEAVKLELETNDDLISFVTSTPVLSLNKLKSIGNVAEKTVKLMFLAPIIKAKKNEGDNRTMYERIINVLMSGIVNTTNTALKSESEKLYFDIQFNSILPDDLSEAAEIVSSLASAGVASKKTLVEYLGLNENVQEELDLIEKEKVAKVPEVI